MIEVYDPYVFEDLLKVYFWPLETIQTITVRFRLS